MNGGKVYYTLNNKLNNNLINIIQKYNINKSNYNYLDDIIKTTACIRYLLFRNTIMFKNSKYKKYKIINSIWYIKY